MSKELPAFPEVQHHLPRHGAIVRHARLQRGERAALLVAARVELGAQPFTGELELPAGLRASGLRRRTSSRI